ncbi:MAG: hypothetical protein WBA17_13385 [Saprospiraceae bacterium]
MSIRKTASVIIYRFRERGLEVFLLNKQDDNFWELPQGQLLDNRESNDQMIELDCCSNDLGEDEEAVAMEGDWHEIPSLKSLLYQDALELKERFKEMEQGSFQPIKQALKQALPHQYKFLKELKDILRDRNSVRDL